MYHELVHAWRHISGFNNKNEDNKYIAIKIPINDKEFRISYMRVVEAKTLGLYRSASDRFTKMLIGYIWDTKRELIIIIVRIMNMIRRIGKIHKRSLTKNLMNLKLKKFLEIF